MLIRTDWATGLAIVGVIVAITYFGASLQSSINNLEKNMNDRFDRVEKRLDRIEERLRIVEVDVKTLMKLFDHHETRLLKLEEKTR